MRIFPDLLSISDQYQGILLDAYGVFWGGNASGLLPGAKEVMEELVASGKIVGILSNSTQLAAKEIEKFEKHGLALGKHYHFLVTSGEVARTIFLNEKLPFPTPRNTFWLLGGPHPKYCSHEHIFVKTPYRESATIEEADFIYISIPHIQGEDQTDSEVFRHQLEELVSKNMPMICPNPDLFAHEGNPPRAVVRQGSIAKMFAEMGGEVFYIGKPHQRAYAFALECFRHYRGLGPQDVLMVGDTPETDIRGARKSGIASALIIHTGIMGDRVAHCGVENALKELPLEDTPNYFIQRLAHGIRSAL
ncbi:MAG: TIGR01459 family HAD-type hydrolase [Verrucomicrobia bacterium]|nr:TIGR01459 family HAD-type hydrolase [Verrucomicrobiota bacterium]